MNFLSQQFNINCNHFEFILHGTNAANKSFSNKVVITKNQT